jgi:hypothetical protein
MSYDIKLTDPVTNKVCEVPGHLMTGGTYKADYDFTTGRFTPALNTEAWINITYNYAPYYYEVLPEKGIRTIYGMTGFDSISVLELLIDKIKGKYFVDGKWIKSQRNKGNDEVDEGQTDDYWKATAANSIRPLYQLIALAKMRPDGIWMGD